MKASAADANSLCGIGRRPGNRAIVGMIALGYTTRALKLSVLARDCGLLSVPFTV